MPLLPKTEQVTCGSKTNQNKIFPFGSTLSEIRKKQRICQLIFLSRYFGAAEVIRGGGEDGDSDSISPQRKGA